MKTKIFWVLLPIILFFGCKTTQVVEKSTTPTRTEEVSNYQKWNPTIHQKLESLDVDPLKLSFFNSSAINLNQNLAKEVVVVVEGKVFLTDSVFPIEKTIKKEELGAIKEKTNKGLPFQVYFSDIDKSYIMNFIYSKEENAYLLSNTATFSFRGAVYKVTPKINEKCYLLFSLTKEKVVTEIKEQAEGVPQP